MQPGATRFSLVRVTRTGCRPVFSQPERRGGLKFRLRARCRRPRILLASVPYALKASDAATLGGLPASAFLLAGSRMAGQVSPQAVPGGTNVTTTGGSAGYIPEFSGASAIVDSIVYTNGTEVGIGTTSPTATLTLDGTMAVNGATTQNGQLLLPPGGTATTSAGYNSQPLKLNGSAYDSSTKGVVSPRFQLQAEVNGNNTAAPNGTLNLLGTSGTAGLGETGLYFNTNGTIHFAAGQTFPGTGTGNGTITGVTAGTDLTGGGTSGSVTLNLDTTKIPTLAANNAFSGNQSFNGFASFNKGLTSNAEATIFTASTGLGVYTTQNGSIYAQLDVPTSKNEYGWAIEGNAYNAYAGVYGYGDDNSQAGVIGSGNIGVYAISDLHEAGNQTEANSLTAAVYAQAGTISNQGNSFSLFPTAVFADGGATTSSVQAQIAIVGTADDHTAAIFANQSDARTLELDNAGTGQTLGTFDANGGRCAIDGSSNLTCTGTISGSNLTADQRTLTTYGVQAAENWYEDAGSGTLQSGAATIMLDTNFAQVVNTGVEYHVFLTPGGDCKGLYVANKGANGFEVRELGGGSSGIAFDYRIMAKRKGYEQARLEDVTEKVGRETALRLKRRSAFAHPAGHPAVPPVPQRAGLQPISRP